jgi:hypothetical protein
VSSHGTGAVDRFVRSRSRRVAAAPTEVPANEREN